MDKKQIPGGLVHNLPADLEKAIVCSSEALETWKSISKKARNEWICWTINVKQDKTRNAHVVRAAKDLASGKRRPCCWVGCIHRTDKAVSPWAQRVLIDKLSRH